MHMYWEVNQNHRVGFHRSVIQNVSRHCSLKCCGDSALHWDNLCEAQGKKVSNELKWIPDEMTSAGAEIYGDVRGTPNGLGSSPPSKASHEVLPSQLMEDDFGKNFPTKRIYSHLTGSTSLAGEHYFKDVILQ